MRRCRIDGCRATADWTWQPFGPSETADCFTAAGWHYRGFPAVPVCEAHKLHLQAGGDATFTIQRRDRKIPYYADLRREILIPSPF